MIIFLLNLDFKQLEHFMQRYENQLFIGYNSDGLEIKLLSQHNS